jgi:hypothetical protein
MTDTTKTRLELTSMAADELGLTGPGQSVEAEDQQYIDARFDGLMGELSGRGIVSISDEDAIPIEWCGPLAELLANECARKFGKQKMVNRVGLENVKLKLDPALTGGSGPLTIARWTRGG